MEPGAKTELDCTPFPTMDQAQESLTTGSAAALADPVTSLSANQSATGAVAESQTIHSYCPPASGLPPPKSVDWVYNAADGSVLLDHKQRPVSVDKLLATKPLRGELSTRPGPGNKKLTYISGEGVSRTLNDIFGFDGWNLDIGKVNREECLKENGKYTVVYTAMVRLTHKASGAYKEDCGAGDSTDRCFGTAVSHALKASITDAMKRAARHFGDKLGNSLYQGNFNIHKAPVSLKDALDKYDIERANTKFGFPKKPDNATGPLGKPEAPSPIVSARPPVSTTTQNLTTTNTGTYTGNISAATRAKSTAYQRAPANSAILTNQPQNHASSGASALPTYTAPKPQMNNQSSIPLPQIPVKQVVPATASHANQRAVTSQVHSLQTLNGTEPASSTMSTSSNPTLPNKGHLSPSVQQQKTGGMPVHKMQVTSNSAKQRPPPTPADGLLTSSLFSGAQDMSTGPPRPSSSYGRQAETTSAALDKRRVSIGDGLTTKPAPLVTPNVRGADTTAGAKRHPLNTVDNTMNSTRDMAAQKRQKVNPYASSAR